MAKRSKECKYKEIERSEEGMNAVFLWFATKNRPYADYPGISEEEQNREVTRILTFNRWDGMVGTVGGKVDPGETSSQALVREVKEEVGYDLNRERIKPLLAVQNTETGFKIQSWVIELEEDEMEVLIRLSSEASHYKAECSGLTLDHVTPMAIEALKDRPFVASAEKEYLKVLEILGVENETI